MSDTIGEYDAANETIQRSNSIAALESVVTTATPASRHYTVWSRTPNSLNRKHIPSSWMRGQKLEVLHRESHKRDHPNKYNHRENDPESYLGHNDRSSTTSREEAYHHFAILEQLRAWDEWEQARRVSFPNYLLRTIGFPSRPPLPNQKELAEMANYYFPPLDNREVIVIDLDRKDDTAESWRRHFSKLSSLEDCLQSKPDSAHLRWIHVPIGRGLLQKHIVSIFEGAAREMHLSTHIFRFKKISHAHEDFVHELVDPFNMLQNVPKDTWLWNYLLPESETSLARFDPKYSDVLERSSIFWLRAASDLPQPIGQVLNIKPENLHGPKIQRITPPKQTLSLHPDYEECVLIQTEMTCVRRSDGECSILQGTWGVSLTLQGVLLTLSTDSGDLLTSVVTEVESKENYKGLSTNQLTEALLCQIINAFQMLVVRNDTELDDAYIQIIQDMKVRRQSRLRRHESIALVEDHVSCMNEISQILSTKTSICNSIESFLTESSNFNNGLKNETNEDPGLDILDRSFGELEELLSEIRGQQEKLPHLLTELKSSLEVFFQLKTVEQNEIALTAESNNQAILLFTVVTVIFLPLSFFTSYFGMNLKGVVDTSKDERYFWVVCGSTTVSILALTLLFGFKRQLYDAIWTN